MPGTTTNHLSVMRPARTATSGGPRSNAGACAPSAGKQSIMSTPPDPKAPFKDQAKRLRTSLADRGIAVTHSDALELVAHQHGARDWNTLAAEPRRDPEPRKLGPVIPVLRIFDVAK